MLARKLEKKKGDIFTASLRKLILHMYHPLKFEITFPKFVTRHKTLGNELNVLRNSNVVSNRQGVIKFKTVVRCSIIDNLPPQQFSREFSYYSKYFNLDRLLNCWKLLFTNLENEAWIHKWNYAKWVLIFRVSHEYNSKFFHPKIDYFDSVLVQTELPKNLINFH